MVTEEKLLLLHRIPLHYFSRFLLHVMIDRVSTPLAALSIIFQLSALKARVMMNRVD
jgi:hypothetical protein